MRPWQGLVWGCALAALAVGGSAHAGWNNVFQVCCNHCGGHAAPVVAGFADPCCPPPCPPPCPQVQCTTRYIQRTFYQPVTTFRVSHYLQPVTTFRTSFYFEPVCSYRYSCFFDPCTCRYQTVATPVTSFRLRSRCCPVTSYLQRTCMTPVTTYRQACYYEPVTTCCTTTTGAPVASLPPGATVTPAPGAAATTEAPPPGTEESRNGTALPPPPPGTEESRSPTAFRPRSPDVQPPRVMPHASDSSYRAPARPPVVRFDRIASRSGHNLEGRVLDGTRLPRSNARVLFVSVDTKSLQGTATTDDNGNFSAQLGAGGWLVYTYDDNGRPVFSRRIEVPAGRSVQVTLVKR
jgi:hypothetical protein